MAALSGVKSGWEGEDNLSCFKKNKFVWTQGGEGAFIAFPFFLPLPFPFFPPLMKNYFSYSPSILLKLYCCRKRGATTHLLLGPKREKTRYPEPKTLSGIYDIEAPPLLSTPPGSRSSPLPPGGIWGKKGGFPAFRKGGSS